MCVTGWKKVMRRSGRSQRSLAQALSTNQAELSLVVQGRAFLTPEKFDRACELLECRPTDLYAEDALEFLYGKGREPQRKRGMRVELEPVQQEFVEWMAKHEGKSKSRIVNEVIDEAILRRKMGL